MLSRVAGQMVAVALVLFVLGRYHSPQLAGAAVALATFPGLLVSPLAGALLDRWRKATLVMVDDGIAALTGVLVGVLAAIDWLPAPLLLVIVTVSALTAPLSSAGGRSLFPLLAPQHLWERANALDSSGYVVATLTGAPLAGALVGVIGGGWTLAVTGLGYAAAAALLFRLPEPVSEAIVDGSVLRNAWQGLRYVVTNPSLRGIALTLGTFNITSGLLVVAIPVLVLGRFHAGPAVVGILWGILGAAGLVSALVVGRIRMQGRERFVFVVALAISLLALILLPLAQAIAVVALSLFIQGLATGPFDVAVFTLRQRRTDRAWFGRVFAVSMAVNSIGTPIGSALAGPLIGWSVNAALWAAVVMVVIAMIFPMLVIPEDVHGPS